MPCYYWMLYLLKLVEPVSLNRCFHEWVKSMIPESMEGMTVSLDGRTIRSAEKMESYENPLHIVSAQVSELGMTFAQKSVEGKRNEISAVQKLLKELEISGCIIIADALNCQKDTAQAVISQGADYVGDAVLRGKVGKASRTEKNRDRIEKRSAFVTKEIGWLVDREEWDGLACIGAVHTEFETKSRETEEWHYYISSRELTATELLHHAHMEWSVETIHCLLNPYFISEILEN